jgi:hypothetical protein
VSAGCRHERSNYCCCNGRWWSLKVPHVEWRRCLQSSAHPWQCWRSVPHFEEPVAPIRLSSIFMLNAVTITRHTTVPPPVPHCSLRALWTVPAPTNTLHCILCVLLLIGCYIFDTVAIFKELTPVLLQRTAIKQFTMTIHTKCAAFSYNIQYLKCYHRMIA